MAIIFSSSSSFLLLYNWAHVANDTRAHDANDTRNWVGSVETSALCRTLTFTKKKLKKKEKQLLTRPYLKRKWIKGAYDLVSNFFNWWSSTNI